jgi:hypothetical protein
MPGYAAWVLVHRWNGDVCSVFGQGRCAEDGRCDPEGSHRRVTSGVQRELPVSLRYRSSGQTMWQAQRLLAAGRRSASLL